MKWSDRLTESTPIPFSEIEEAFQFVSSGDGESRAVLCRKSGKIRLKSALAEINELAELEDEQRDDPDDEEHVDIPDKRERDLGQLLIFAFVSQVMPGDVEEVRRMFRQRDAHRRFKDFLSTRNRLEQWYELENAATERALREWCKLNSITLID